MVNYSKKIAQALTIIRKYYGAINIQRTDNEDVVYLFDYTTQKKTIGSEKINKAIEKAVKQNDFPKDIYYSEGLLSVIKIQENVQQYKQPETIEAETDEAVEAEEITETEKPKKRGRKKQIDAES
jgi:kynureninase